MKYKNLCLIAMFAAFISVISPFSIPIGAIPLSLATLSIYITAVCIGKRGTLSVLVFVVLGAIGLPVFSGFRGGFDVVSGLTGGYIIGYIPCAFIIGAVRDKTKKFWPLIPAALIGTAILYAVGTAQYMLLSKNPLLPSLMGCVIPFLPGDAIKITIALLISLKTGKVKMLSDI